MVSVYKPWTSRSRMPRGGECPDLVFDSVRAPKPMPLALCTAGRSGLVSARLLLASTGRYAPPCRRTTRGNISGGSALTSPLPAAKLSAKPPSRPG